MSSQIASVKSDSQLSRFALSCPADLIAIHIHFHYRLYKLWSDLLDVELDSKKL